MQGHEQSLKTSQKFSKRKLALKVLLAAASFGAIQSAQAVPPPAPAPMPAPAPFNYQVCLAKANSLPYAWWRQRQFDVCRQKHLQDQFDRMIADMRR